MDPEETGQGSVEQDSQGIESSVDNSTGPEGTGNNPAWNDFLEVVPSQLHSQVTPVLSKWDQGVQQKINQVHSQYEPYKPFLEEKIAPDQINYALSVIQAIENNPKEVLQALQAYIGEDENAEQGQNNQQPGDGSTDTPDWLNHPEFKKINDMVTSMAQIMVQQRQTETQAQEDARIEGELKTLKEKHGDFDEQWVLTKALADDGDLDKAVQAYKQFETSVLEKQRQPGPKVLGAGGSVPNPTSTKGMDSKDRRSIVQQMLANAAQQNH